MNRILKKGQVTATIEWADGNPGSLLLSEIEKQVATFAEAIGKKARKPIDQVTYQFKGKQHIVAPAKYSKLVKA